MTDVTSIQSGTIEALLNGTSAAEGTTETADGTEGLLDDFMTILLAQFEYQDPLNPMEGTDMTAQLAQISSLEQQVNTNEMLETISGQLGELQGSDLLGYLGKEVWMEGGILNVQDGSAPKGTYGLDEAGDVEIAIYDEEGTEVRRLYLENVPAGEHDLEWDGTDFDGAAVDDGAYYFDVVATDEEGSYISYWALGTGIVTGITFENEEPYLMIGDNLLSPDTVIRVCTPSFSGSDADTTA